MAALFAVPEHLLLGVTARGLRELVSKLPDDALEVANAARSDAFPEYTRVDGHVLIHYLAELGAADDLACCERMAREGSDHARPATHWLIYGRATPLADVVAACEAFTMESGEAPVFWVADYAIRPCEAEADLSRVQEVVEALGKAVVVVEDWRRPVALDDARCRGRRGRLTTPGARRGT